MIITFQVVLILMIIISFIGTIAETGELQDKLFASLFTSIFAFVVITFLF